MNDEGKTEAICFLFIIPHSAFPPSFILKIMIQQNRGGEQAQDGTRHRVVECRRRLRRVRVVQRTLRLSRDEAVIAATEILALDETETVFADAEEIFEEARPSFSRKI